VPLGALLILAAVSNWQWGPFEHVWAFAAGAVVVAVMTLAISRYYDEHFGRITSTTRDQVRAAGMTVAVAGIVLGGSLVLRSEAGWSLDVPVNALAASLAAAMLTHYAVAVGLQRHHIVIWGGVLVAGLLPVWGGLNISDTSNVGLVMGGVAAMLSGVLDHLVLVRRFGSARAPILKAGNGGA
jgi:4-hydroxybenzoate polyprenyltransferase